MKTIIEDERKIIAIHLYDDHQTHDYTVGRKGVTEIIVYGEPASIGLAAWLAVKVGDDIVCRLPTHLMAIYYERKQ